MGLPCYWSQQEVLVLLPDEGLVGKVDSYSVQTVDTTGAGDAFLGAIQYGVLETEKALQDWEEEELREALRFANAAGALATTRKGAIPSLGTLEEIHTLVRDGNRPEK